MIFGSYYFNLKNESKVFIIKNFLKEFKNCKVNEIDFENFKGGFLLNNFLPYKNSDCLFKDSLKDILILKTGNIYNKSQLCDFYNFNQKLNDLELINKLFLLLGAKFVNELNGDFVIFLYQPKLKTFYLFRDHLGVIPIAYILEDFSFSFSSDILGLCKLSHSQDKINIEPLLSVFKFVDLTQLPNEKVKLILPGHFLKFENGEIEIVKYWEPEKIKVNNKLTYNQVIKELDFLLKDAVHIRSDKRFLCAAHVSGGLDSGVVSALVRKEYNAQEHFYGYSWSPDNFSSENVEFDERVLVKETCQMNNIEPIFVNVSAEDYDEQSKKEIRFFGYVSEQKIIDHARKEGVNLIFSGFGGDEFISKGDGGINTDLLLNLNWDLFFKKNSLAEPRNLVSILLYEVLFPFFNLVSFHEKKAQKNYVKYLKKKFKKNHYTSLKNLFFYKSRRQLHLGYIYQYHIGERAGLFYVNGFLNGIEYRYPLLDKRIVEYMMAVPSNNLIYGQFSRIILRKLGDGIIPEKVRWLRKGVDPVVYSNATQIIQKFSKSIIKKIQEFESNPDLEFVDFEKLKKDISKFERSDDFEFFLNFSLVQINRIHEFTKGYRGID